MRIDFCADHAASKVNEIVDIIFRFIIFDFRRKHDIGMLTDLANDCDERIIRHFSFYIKSLSQMVVFDQCLSEFGIILIKREFSISVQIDQIVFVFFLAYLFQKIKKHLFWNGCFKDLTGHTMKKNKIRDILDTY